MAAGARTGGRMEVDHEVVARRGATCCASSRCSRAAGSRTPGAGRSTSPPPTCRSSRACPACPPGPRSATPATASARRICWAGRWPRWRSTARDDGHAAAVRGRPPPRVPPEPLRVAGAAAIRRALVRKEAAEEARPPAGSAHARARRAARADGAPHRALTRAAGAPTGARWDYGRATASDGRFAWPSRLLRRGRATASDGRFAWPSRLLRRGRATASDSRFAWPSRLLRRGRATASEGR